MTNLLPYSLHHTSTRKMRLFQPLSLRVLSSSSQKRLFIQHSSLQWRRGGSPAANIRTSDNKAPPGYRYIPIEDVGRLEGYRPGGYHPVRIGDQLRDRYRVFQKLGYGSYSTIWLYQSACSAQNMHCRRHQNLITTTWRSWYPRKLSALMRKSSLRQYRLTRYYRPRFVNHPVGLVEDTLLQPRRRRKMELFGPDEQDVFSNMLKQILSFRPEDRPSATEVLRSQWMVKWALPEYEKAWTS